MTGNNIKISVCCSAIYVFRWLDCYNSLKDNKLEWELIFVGPNTPPFELPSNFKYIYSTTKPAQCYEIAFRQAQGELIHWTADDSLYPPSALDNIYNLYQTINNEKVVIAFRTIEDNRDITDWHRFRGRDITAPRMAPFGVMSRKLFHELGGYDKRFICGQSENDVVMRVYEIGGTVKVSNIPIYVHHAKVHYAGTVFRSDYYFHDRLILESMWVKDRIIQTKRLEPVQSFSDEDILTVTQGPKGKW